MPLTMPLLQSCPSVLQTATFTQSCSTPRRSRRRNQLRCSHVTSCNTLKIMLNNLGNVPYPTQGFPAVPEIFLHFSEACCSIPAISKTDPYPSLQLPKNPRTREPEMTGPEPCTGMTRPNPTLFPNVVRSHLKYFLIPIVLLFLLFCSLYLVLLCSLNHLSSFHVLSMYLPFSCSCFLRILCHATHFHKV